MRPAAALLLALCIAASPHARRTPAATAVAVSAAAASADALFSSETTFNVSLTAPFAELFDKSDQDADYEVPGSLAYTDAGREVLIKNVRVSVRGHSSRQESECTFPKLKLSFDESDGRGDSVFEKVDTVKIGTHCGETPGESLTHKYGRLANEKSPIREAFVYRLLAAAGVPTLRARPARITYHDVTPGGAPLVRNAMLLEDTEDAAKRLHAGHEISTDDFRSAADDFAVADTVRLAFAEAMIGNFDWCLKFTPDDTYRCDAKRPLWNIAALARDGQRALPLMYDFDVSGMVTGSHFWFGKVLNERIVPSRSHAEVEVISQLQHTRSLFARADLDAARRHFLQRKDLTLAALRTSTIDPGGKDSISRYLTAFFDAIGSDEAFYRPVITAPETMAYAEAEGSRAACPDAPMAPPGTVIGEPLARRRRRVQVEVLDSLWHWTGPRACAAIRDAPVWIDAEAIGTDYPAPTGDGTIVSGGLRPERTAGSTRTRRTPPPISPRSSAAR